VRAGRSLSAAATTARPGCCLWWHCHLVYLAPAVVHDPCRHYRPTDHTLATSAKPSGQIETHVCLALSCCGPRPTCHAATLACQLSSRLCFHGAHTYGSAYVARSQVATKRSSHPDVDRLYLSTRADPFDAHEPNSHQRFYSLRWDHIVCFLYFLLAFTKWTGLWGTVMPLERKANPSCFHSSNFFSIVARNRSFVFWHKTSRNMKMQSMLCSVIGW
jgi:hypothetical protein